jgi:hypothetical protein
MAKNFDIERHTKELAYTTGLLVIFGFSTLITYNQIQNGNYQISFVLVIVSTWFLIVFVILAYRLVTSSNLKKSNRFEAFDAGRSVKWGSGGGYKIFGKKPSRQSFGLSIQNNLKLSRNTSNYRPETVSRIDHLDCLFYTEIDGSVKCFAGWILWRFLHDGEWKQVQIDAEYRGKRGKPPGAFSRSTWNGTAWRGKAYRYEFNWSKRNWSMVYNILVSGILEFYRITNIKIATGLGEGETLRLSRGAGYVYEAVSTSLLSEWNWLKEIRMAPRLVRADKGRSGLVDQ